MHNGVFKQALSLPAVLASANEHDLLITAFLFPNDDPEVLRNISDVVARLSDRVKYIVIFNKIENATYSFYKSSPLEKKLADFGAATVTLPVLDHWARLKLSQLELKRKERIPFDDAVTNTSLGLDYASRGMLEVWLKKMFSIFDDNADSLVPVDIAKRIWANRKQNTDAPANVELGNDLNLDF